MTPKEGDKKVRLYTGYLTLAVMVVLIVVVFVLVIRFIIGLMIVLSMGV